MLIQINQVLEGQVVLVELVLFEFQHRRGLSDADVHRVVHCLHKFVLSEDETLATVVARNQPVGEENRLFRAGFLAEAAKYASHPPRMSSRADLGEFCSAGRLRGKALPVPFHSGAVRYFKERGLKF